jgi:Fructose-bisphosphate aldolase class-II
MAGSPWAPITLTIWNTPWLVPRQHSKQSAFIIQLSKGARSYADKRILEAMIRAAEEIFPESIFAVHLDHGDEPTYYDCIDSGVDPEVVVPVPQQIVRDSSAALGMTRVRPRGVPNGLQDRA